MPGGGKCGRCWSRSRARSRGPMWRQLEMCRQLEMWRPFETWRSDTACSHIACRRVLTVSLHITYCLLLQAVLRYYPFKAGCVCSIC
jgi:hypothetical protein